MATNLFEFEFASALTPPQLDEIRTVTGMDIGDIGDPYKDTPGKGRFAGNVFIFLGREQGEDAVEPWWHIRAFTPDPSHADLETVYDRKQQLRDLMPRIAAEGGTAWREIDIEQKPHYEGTEALRLSRGSAPAMPR